MMAIGNCDFDANLAAAAGDNALLRAELLACFSESVTNHAGLLHRARCDANWRIAAMRLKGLGASFHSPSLSALAQEALDAAPGDPVILRKLCQFCQGLAQQS